MSKVFARYIVKGDSEDMKAFEAIVRHIDMCIMTGSSRDITISVDGDGSANLSFYRSDVQKDLSDEEMDEHTPVEYLDYPKELRDEIFEGKEDIPFGCIGVIKAGGDGEYSIGE